MVIGVYGFNVFPAYSVLIMETVVGVSFRKIGIMRINPITGDMRWIISCLLNLKSRFALLRNIKYEVGPINNNIGIKLINNVGMSNKSLVDVSSK